MKSSTSELKIQLTDKATRSRKSEAIRIPDELWVETGNS